MSRAIRTYAVPRRAVCSSLELPVDAVVLSVAAVGERIFLHLIVERRTEHLTAEHLVTVVDSDADMPEGDFIGSVVAGDTSTAFVSWHHVFLLSP